MSATIKADAIRLQYREKVVIDNISLKIEQPEVISIIGPNGSGKSTLLKALSRLLIPTQGTVLLNGENIERISSAVVAKMISVLPQSAVAPGDITVQDLAMYGRMPYQGFLSQLSQRDREAVARALEFTELTHMSDRRLDTLSGGERQRAWLAMALAQEPRVLLLDEPTTYLDIHHQLELMELILKLHRDNNMTVIMVLHDLNHAARYSNRLVALKDGAIIADDCVEKVFTADILEHLYNVKAFVTEMEHENKKYPICFPYSVSEH